tara:strand:+ start:11832 stop:12605 length:774 start_codon:yes stop_codon:yes gene_type:complete
MLSNQDDFVEVFRKLGLKKNDKISVGSSILKILSLNKYKYFKPNIILEALKKVISSNGTLMIDAFCWDFCKTKKFDYYKTTNQIGSLAKIALSDKKFVRSKNPIYSFMVYGKNKNNIAKLKHYSCFEINSPFGYIINSNGKYVLIDLDFRAHAYVHVAEQIVGMKHRFFKIFSGQYVDKKGKKLKVKYEMYCRKLEDNIETFIDPKFKNCLKKNNAIKEIRKNGINFISIDAYKAHKLMINDLKNDQKFIYTKKIQR